MNCIASIREQAKIKQRDLITALGWTQTRVSNYETGHRTPGIPEARAIVRALNALGARCTLDDVFPPESETSDDESGARKKAA